VTDRDRGIDIIVELCYVTSLALLVCDEWCLLQVAMATGQVLYQRFYFSKSFVKHNYEVTNLLLVGTNVIVDIFKF